MAEKSSCFALVFRTLKSCLSPTSTGNLNGKVLGSTWSQCTPAFVRIFCACPVWARPSTLQLVFAVSWFCNRHVLRLLWCLTRFVTNFQQTVLASDTGTNLLSTILFLWNPLFAHYCLRVNLSIKSLWIFLIIRVWILVCVFIGGRNGPGIVPVTTVHGR